MTDTNQESRDIYCPFLKLANADTSGFFKMAADLDKAGMEYKMAMYVIFKVAWSQKGLGSALVGNVPDVYRLNEVEGVSHPDKYFTYLAETKEKVAAAQDKDGLISLQELANIKMWIAKEKCNLSPKEMLTSSKLETGLAWIAAGGDLETGKCNADDFLSFIQAKAPSKPFQVTVQKMEAAKKFVSWKGQEAN